MPIDASIYDKINTNFGQQLGDIFNPQSIEARQNKLAQAAMGTQLQQLQLQNAQLEAQRAPILRQREDVAYQTALSDAEIARQLKARQERNLAAAIASMTPEQQAMVHAGEPVKDIFEQARNEKNIQRFMEAMKPQTEARPLQGQVTGAFDTSPQGLAKLQSDLSRLPESERAGVREAMLQQGIVQPVMVQPSEGQQLNAMTALAMGGFKGSDAPLKLAELQMKQNQLRSEGQLNRDARAENAQARIDSQSQIAGMRKDFTAEKPLKPLPPVALKMQQEGLDAIGTASGINVDLGTIQEQIKTGKLKLGPVENMKSIIKNKAGQSDDVSRNFATFGATLEKLRNDSLRLNKGVQTDGDAQRAWNELLSNINDPDVVNQRLGEIQKINERAVILRKLDIDNVRRNYGYGSLDTEGYQNLPGALNRNVTESTGSLTDAAHAEIARRQGAR